MLKLVPLVLTWSCEWRCWDSKPALRTSVAGGDGDHFHVTLVFLADRHVTAALGTPVSKVK
jgi:hypothetical protein